MPSPHPQRKIDVGVRVSSVADVIGPADPQASQSHEIAVIAGFAADTLVPHANRIDQRGIRRPHLDELAATGALGLPFPTALGGSDAPAGIVREATELIAGACGTTWFCAAQHRSPTKAVLASDNALLHDRWAARLVSGNALAAIAFAHLRRPTQRFWIRDEGDRFVLNGSSRATSKVHRANSETKSSASWSNHRSSTSSIRTNSTETTSRPDHPCR